MSVRNERPPTPSATVVMMRERAGGLEVFMVKRHRAIEFASGATVFPGGKLEPGDSNPALEPFLQSPAAGFGKDIALRVAAVREVFEETGVLLARTVTGSPLTAERRDALKNRHWSDINRGSTSLADLLAKEDLRLAVDRLVPFAHWITPNVVPRRFDTMFYLTLLDQATAAGAGHDGREAVSSTWITPSEALAEADAGRMVLVFATRLNLMKLAGNSDPAAAIQAARATPIVTVCPEVSDTPTQRILRIPAAAGYGETEFRVAKTADK